METVTAQSFIRSLLEVDPTTRMSLTDALVHPWLDPSAPSGSGTTPSSGTARYARSRSLSDVSELSELSELPEDNDPPSMLSAEPSSDVMLGVHTLSLRSPPAPANGRARPPLERRSDVLARESEAEAAATATVAPSSPSTDNNNNNGGGSGGGIGTGKRPRSGSPADVAMSGESCDDDAAAGGGAAMETEPPSLSRAAKRGRRNGGRQSSSSSSSPPTAVGNGNGNGDRSSGRRVLRSRVAVTAGGSRR